MMVVGWGGLGTSTTRSSPVRRRSTTSPMVRQPTTKRALRSSWYTGDIALPVLTGARFNAEDLQRIAGRTNLRDCLSDRRWLLPCCRRENCRRGQAPMPDLLIRLTIPIDPDDRPPGTPLIFNRWLPIEDAQAIRVVKDDLAVKLWFGMRSILHGADRTPEDLPRIHNVLAYTVFADITVRNVSADVLSYIARRDFTRGPTAEEEPLLAACDDIAHRSLDLTLRTLNRLLAYVKAQHGQFWLREHALRLEQANSLFVGFKAKARTEGTEWHRFGPGAPDVVHGRIESDERYVHADQWEAIRDFVTSPHRPPFVGTLLAGAEAHAAAGHGPAALTEAVTALEVAVARFAARPASNRIFEALRGRLDVQSLSKQVKRLGLSGTMRYLLPVLLPESVLPRGVLEDCWKAIDQRQCVVHKGQREVEADVLRRSLAAIRRLCKVLEGATSEPASGSAEESAVAASLESAE